MNILSIFLIIFIGFIGVSLIFSGISLLGYNSTITKVTGNIQSNAPDDNNCMILPSGISLCNYNVIYTSPSGSVSTVIGTEKNINIGDNIDLYIIKDSDQVSTVDIFIPWYYPWLLIFMGILDFVFMYYIYCNQQSNKYEQNKISREQIEYIFGNDDIVY